MNLVKILILKLIKGNKNVLLVLFKNGSISKKQKKIHTVIQSNKLWKVTQPLGLKLM